MAVLFALEEYKQKKRKHEVNISGELRCMRTRVLVGSWATQVLPAWSHCPSWAFREDGAWPVDAFPVAEEINYPRLGGFELHEFLEFLEF